MISCELLGQPDKILREQPRSQGLSLALGGGEDPGNEVAGGVAILLVAL